MHFFPVSINFRKESNIWGNVLRRQVAPLCQEISYITIVEVVSSKHIIGKGAINSESFLTIAICKQT
jgi:hypothetical protein